MADPEPEASGPIVLYDGECGFCTRGVLFAFARDPRGRFRYASLQSATGRALLRRHDVPETADTMILVQDGRAYLRSAAALHVARGLRWPWSWLGALGFVVPRALRDAVYDLIAKRRHHLRPAEDACVNPSPELRRRLLD